MLLKVVALLLVITSAYGEYNHTFLLYFRFLAVIN